MYAFVINTLNSLIKGIGLVLSTIFSVLPTSPFTLISNSPIAEYLPTLNYFVPISEIISISETWLVCVGAYYIYQIALRWIKAIE